MKILVITLLLPFMVNAQSGNGFDDFFKETLTWKDTEKAGDVSDVLRNGLLVAPFVTSFFTEDTKKRSLQTGGIILFTGLLTRGLKHVTHRQRPDKSDYKDFPSGHASSAMVGATLSCGMIKEMCIPAYVAAISTGLLRVMANRHHMSSVIFGLGIGHANGLWLPQLTASW